MLIQTENQKPDWGDRLNAWLAAWNMGSRKARGQAPLPSVTIDGDSIREFRLLVDDLMGRVENLARTGSTWFAEERTRSRRVALLKPYNLRFHQDEGGNIQLIFFNGAYAQYYGQFLKTTGPAEGSGAEEWSRTFQCSRCRGLKEHGRLTTRADNPSSRR